MNRENSTQKIREAGRNFLVRHPIIGNLIIIIIVAILGIWIAYIGTAIFTKHGRSRTVPAVENMSYSNAINTLHAAGLRTEIRDSLYRDDVKPGYVIEQFPKANSIVKPGRKIFLYINAVHPKEVIIDDDNNPREDALRGYPQRQGLARLEELGFKHVQIVRVVGENDRIIKVKANGKVVKKMQKIPLNSQIVVEVSDGRLHEMRDSLSEAEMARYSIPDETEFIEENSEENPDEYVQ